MRTKIFAVVAAVVLSVSLNTGASAEVIYLKNGKIVKEKIVERGSYYIVTMENNVPRKYFDAQIDRIEEDALDTSGVDVEQFKEAGMPVEKAKLIVALVNVSGVRASMQKSIEDVLGKVPEEQKATYAQMFDIDEIIERLIPLYDKYYTEADLQGMITFYESPAGQKVIESTPEIVKESIGVLVEYVQEKAKP
jgi:hypothetical protein